MDVSIDNEVSWNIARNLTNTPTCLQGNESPLLLRLDDSDQSQSLLQVRLLSQRPVDDDKQSQSQSLLPQQPENRQLTTSGMEDSVQSQSLLPQLPENRQPEQSGSPSLSLYSNTSTPITNDKIDDPTIHDRLNGILYHVIETTGRISVLFNSRGSFQTLTDALITDFGPRISCREVQQFVTHIHGKRCVLNTDNDRKTLIITGPGNTLWWENNFKRHAVRMFKEFEKTINEHIESQHQTSLTSRRDTGPPLSPIATQPPAQTQQNGTPQEQDQFKSEIMSQITELKQTSTILQDQLRNIDRKLDALLNTQTSQEVVQPAAQTGAQKIHDVSDTTLEDGFITLSTTGENPQLLPGASSYKDALTKRPLTKDQTKADNQERKKSTTCPSNTERRNQTGAQRKETENVNPIPICDPANERQQKQHTEHYRPQNVENEHRTLLIGDSILSGINRKGLNKNVECLPVPGAKIDTISDRIQMYDLTKFSSIVLYVGGNNASSQTDTEYFEEKYTQLLTRIRNKNPGCQVYLCTSCPRGDTDVTDVNDILTQLCIEKGLKCININSAFYDRQGQLRSHFYKPRDNIHLSRSGVKRVLGSINQHVQIVENFERCVYPITSSYNSNRGREPSRIEPADLSPRTEESGQPNHQGYAYENGQINEWRSPRHRYQQHNPNNAEAYQQDVDNRSAGKCLKCGLNNHPTEDCRHKTQVQCYNCKFYGHKESSGLCRRR